jgi:hypothetical protein
MAKTEGREMKPIGWDDLQVSAPITEDAIHDATLDSSAPFQITGEQLAYLLRLALEWRERYGGDSGCRGRNPLSQRRSDSERVNFLIGEDS